MGGAGGAGLRTRGRVPLVEAGLASSISSHRRPGGSPRLGELVERIRDDDSVAYKTFSTADELAALLRDDLAVLLGERFLLDEAGGVSMALIRRRAARRRCRTR